MEEIKYRREDEMKDSGIEWLGKIPKEWDIYRIKDCFRDVSIKNYDPEATLLSLYTEFGVRKNEDIEEKRGNKSQTVIEYKKVKKNDIIVNKMLAWMGAIGISNYDGVVSPAYSVYRLYKKKANAKYYHYLFRDKAFSGECFKNGWGIMLMRWSITPERFRSIYIPVPNSELQQKIANFLDYKTSQFDSIISKKEKLIEKLEEAKKSLISEVVTGKVKIVDGEIVERKAEEMKDSGVEWLGMIPKDWEVKRLKYLMDINPPKSEVLDKNIECSFVPMNMIHNGVIETEDIKLIKDVYRGYTYFKNEDIVMAKVTPCYENGNIAIARNLKNGIGFGTTEINVFRAHNNNEFIYYLMQESHFVRYGSSHMTGVAGLKRVPTSYFENYKAPIPNIAEQNEIAIFLNKKIKDINNIINKTKTQIQKLKEAKQSLISEAVTGKIDLRDWEIREVDES